MYDNPEDIQNVRHTVRYRRDLDKRMRALAEVVGEQPGAFIRAMSVVGAAHLVRNGLDGLDEDTKKFFMRQNG